MEKKINNQNIELTSEQLDKMFNIKVSNNDISEIKLLHEQNEKFIEEYNDKLDTFEDIYDQQTDLRNELESINVKIKKDDLLNFHEDNIDRANDMKLKMKELEDIIRNNKNTHSKLKKINESLRSDPDIIEAIDFMNDFINRVDHIMDVIDGIKN